MRLRALYRLSPVVRARLSRLRLPAPGRGPRSDRRGRRRPAPRRRVRRRRHRDGGGRPATQGSRRTGWTRRPAAARSSGRIDRDRRRRPAGGSAPAAAAGVEVRPARSPERPASPTTRSRSRASSPTPARCPARRKGRSAARRPTSRWSTRTAACADARSRCSRATTDSIPAKARGEFLRLEPQVLAFIGSFAVADSGLHRPHRVDEASRTSRSSIEPEGRGATQRHAAHGRPAIANTGPFVWLKQQHPKREASAAVLYADVGGVSANVPGLRGGDRSGPGFDRRYTAAADVTSPDYTPEVRQAQDQGVEFFYLFAFEVNMHVRMVRNMRQQNYDPPIKGVEHRVQHAVLRSCSAATATAGRTTRRTCSSSTRRSARRSSDLAKFHRLERARLPGRAARPVPGVRVGPRGAVRRRRCRRIEGDDHARGA